MSSNFFLIKTSILIITLCISYAKATEIKSTKNSSNITEFNSWSSLLGQKFKYDSIKNLALQKDYIIISQLNTHPLELETFIVEDSRVIYISSGSNRKVTCQITNDLGNLNLISESRLLEVEDDLIEMHPFYTIVETRKNTKVATYSFKSFHNSPLRNEIDRVEGILFRAILNKCNNIEVESFSSTN